MARKYVFKFNLGPNALTAYENDMSYTISNIIPTDLEKVFNKTLEKGKNIKYEQKNEYQEISNSQEYINLKKFCDQSIAMYDDVVSMYREYGTINYSKKYMDLRDSLNHAINDIVKKYTSLESAFSRKRKDISSDIFEIRMNTRYINKALKIIDEVNSMNDSERQKISFYYDTLNEYIYLSAENENDAIKKSIFIQSIINSYSSETNIGEINIQPKYSGEIEFVDGNFKNVVVEQVFPNGSARRRGRATRSSSTNAKKISTTFESDKNDELDVTRIVDDDLENDIKSGYATVKSRGKSILKTPIMTIIIDK